MSISTTKEININDFLNIVWKFITDVFLKTIVPYLQHFIPLLLIDVLTFLITMAVVYAIGRMLMVTKSDRIKNTIALLCILALNWWICLYNIQTVETITDMVIHSSIGILLYVLLGFKLFDRVDTWLDTHFAKDKTRRKK